MSDLSDVVPLLARVYPNGIADVNHFHAAGGMGFLIRELLDAGFLHEDVQDRLGRRALGAYTVEAKLGADGKRRARAGAGAVSGDAQGAGDRGQAPSSRPAG